MVYKVNELSVEQREVIEALLGRSVTEDEDISVSSFEPQSAPEALRASWESARRHGLDQLSPEEIDAEIKAAREARRLRARISTQ